MHNVIYEGNILKLMWSKLAHYNLVTRKSQEHSKELLELFNTIHHPIENNPTFDERIKSEITMNLPPNELSED
jgi:acyl-CoA thioester hydrolase